MSWILLCMMSLTLVACNGNGGISQVTSLPHTATEHSQIGTVISTSHLIPAPTLSQLERTATAVAKVTQVNDDASIERSTGNNSFGLATFTPAPNRLPPGEARSIAIATDTLMQPQIENPITFEETPVDLRFDEFYGSFSVRTGWTFSDKLKSLDGQQVTMIGYVAPPLKPRLDFFVLTRLPLAFCPFCSTDVEWPDDIALVYLNEPAILSSAFPVRITGQLEVGSSVDAETGMVSLVRIYADSIEKME